MEGSLAKQPTAFAEVGKTDTTPKGCVKARTVLHVGPGAEARGGIAAVINAYLKSEPAGNYRFVRLVTHDDRSLTRKLLSLVSGWLLAPAAVLKADLVHIHTASKYSFLRKIPILLLAKCFGRAAILHIHGGAFRHYFDSSPRVFQRAVMSVLRLPDRILLLSPAKHSELAPILGNRAVSIIPNPCPSPCVTNVAVRPVARRVLFAGWLEREKGVFDLIEAFAAVAGHEPELRLVLAGKGQLAECRAMAQRLGIGDRVELPGWLRGAELERCFADADIFCLPSYGEGMPMSILQAMAFGLPTVASDVGGIPDLLVHERHGLLIPPGNIEMLSTAIRRLLHERSLRQELGENSLARARDEYSMASVTERLVCLYDSTFVA